MRRAAAGHATAGPRDQGDNAPDHPGREAADERRLHGAGASLRPAADDVADAAAAAPGPAARHRVAALRRLLAVLPPTARLHPPRLTRQVPRTKVHNNNNNNNNNNNTLD